MKINDKKNYTQSTTMHLIKRIQLIYIEIIKKMHFVLSSNQN